MKTSEMSLSEKYDYLIEHECFTCDELHLAFHLNGYSTETLNNCIYVRFGFRDFQQLYEDLEQN